MKFTPTIGEIYMPVEKHDLVYELPESKETIRHLKTTDTHFAELFNEYHQVESDVHRYEAGAENTSDEHLEDLKKRRLNLKDQLTRMVRDHEASTG